MLPRQTKRKRVIAAIVAAHPCPSLTRSVPILGRVGKTNLALAAGLVALVLLGALATLALRGSAGDGVADAALPSPPPVTVLVTVPSPAPVDAKAVAPAPKRKPVRPAASRRRVKRNDAPIAVAPAGVAAFYPIYDAAQKTFQVNWLLLASVHAQETAFSTEPDTYHGRNSAGCCAGPMQFNVTNGPVTTWERYRAAYQFARRPAAYGHMTRFHPSIYDDFDSVMAAGALLRDSGATVQLDASAWRAAYDYYGHDLTGIDYASHVVARAIGWAQTGFCTACATDASLLNAVDAAYAAPVRAELAPPATKARAASKRP